MAVNSTDGDIVHKARWKSKAFEDSPYYTIRIDDWSGNKVRGIEWIHHKIYLANNPAGITNFSISDGYNLLMFNLGKRSNGIIRRWGAGLIFAHVDMTLQGRDPFGMMVVYLVLIYLGWRFSMPLKHGCMKQVITWLLLKVN